MLALLLASLLAADPLPASSPPAKTQRQCYLPHTEWAAKPGEAVKGNASCLAGYVQSHATLDLGNGTTVDLVICCPAVDTSAAADQPKKEK